MRLLTHLVDNSLTDTKVLLCIITLSHMTIFDWWYLQAQARFTAPDSSAVSNSLFTVLHYTHLVRHRCAAASEAAGVLGKSD